MVRFIKQEAEEKANEIGISAEEVSYTALLLVELCCYVKMSGNDYLRHVKTTFYEDSSKDVLINSCAGFTLQEFNIEKLQLLENEKGKVKKDYERREGQIEVKKKM